MSSTKISKDYQDGYDLGYKNGYVDGAKDFQPKKGKWVEVDDGLVSGRCSLCGWEAVIMETDVCGMSFCPNCGAKMDMEGDV